MHRKLLTAVLMGAALSFRMADDAPAAPTQAPAADPAAPVTLTVAPEHADLLQRAIAVIEKGGQFVLDNIEAGVAALEAYLKPADDQADSESKEA